MSVKFSVKEMRFLKYMRVGRSATAALFLAFDATSPDPAQAMAKSGPRLSPESLNRYLLH
jgi:hypothetical protein